MLRVRDIFLEEPSKDETMALYCTRLRVVSNGCEYATLDDKIRNQIVIGCHDEGYDQNFLARVLIQHWKSC